MDNTQLQPKLIDSQTGHYLMNTLRQCHETRVVTYSYIFNMIIVVGFVAITASVLYICFTRKNTPQQESIRMEQEKKFILEKIRSLQEQKQYYMQEESVTKLPMTTRQM